MFYVSQEVYVSLSGSICAYHSIFSQKKKQHLHKLQPPPTSSQPPTTPKNTEEHEKPTLKTTKTTSLASCQLPKTYKSHQSQASSRLESIPRRKIHLDASRLLFHGTGSPSTGPCTSESQKARRIWMFFFAFGCSIRIFELVFLWLLWVFF